MRHVGTLTLLAPLPSLPGGGGRRGGGADYARLGSLRGRRLLLVVPHVRDTETNQLFDSTTNNMRSPGMFVTYHDAQAYPEYIVKFNNYFFRPSTSTSATASNNPILYVEAALIKSKIQEILAYLEPFQREE